MSVGIVVRLCDVMGTAVEYVVFCCDVDGSLEVTVEATVLVPPCDAVVLETVLRSAVLLLAMVVDEVEHDAVCSPTPTQYALPSQKSLIAIIIESAGAHRSHVISFLGGTSGHAYWFGSPQTRWDSIQGTQRH